MTRENLVELLTNQIAGSLSPTPSGNGRVKNPPIFGHREIGTKRQFLKDAPYPQFLGKKRRITFLRLRRRPMICP